MLYLLKNCSILSFVTILIFTVSCTPTAKIDSKKPNSKSIQSAQSSPLNKENIYTVQNNDDEVKIGKISVDDINFNIPKEEITYSENHSKNQKSKKPSRRTSLNKEESPQNFFTWFKNITVFESHNTFKEFESSKRSSMAIAFNKALTNGNMMPDGAMKAKGKASSNSNQNTIIGIVLLGASLVSLLLALLFLPIPILALLFFLGFLGLGVAGLVLFIQGLTS